ncbi:hypothetical protein [Terrimonas alba]|uniref:hypothetical protein n=1 Tax=Terrimonas alba TaxID=3349636 RepID=UPI0035F32355
MKRLYIVIIITTLFIQQKATAQGCVAVRQMGGVNTLCSSTNSYNLSKGDFQIGANYRYFHSWRHFVGKEEQKHRQNTGGGLGTDGIDRGNAVNIYSHAVDLNLSYGLTNRLQVYASIPYVHNERSQVLRQTAPVKDTFRYSVFAKGLGDVRIGTNYWLFDPVKAHKGNLNVGIGIKLPTGSHSEVDQAPQTNGTFRYTMMDQAIQPGDGGLGFSLEMQGFTQVYRGIYAFANGYYLFNPKESNGTFKSGPTVVKDKDGNILGTLTGYNVYACPDQYFGRAGLMTSILKSRNLTLSLAGRVEGIPAYDALGGQVAYRRPGYVVAIESGVSYTTKQHSFSLFVPYNIVRNRIQSAADIARQNLQNSVITDKTQLTHVQGDAAFADYSISLSYSYRIPKNRKK